MEEVVDKYLHKIDLDKLQEETGLSHNELAELANIGPKVIYKWSYMHKDSSRPDYNALVRLLEKGATVETLFGVEYAKMHREFKVDTSIQHIFDSPEFKANLEKAVKDLNDRGLIK
jgi:hypothetical protein